MNQQFFNNNRVAFMVDMCQHCRVWKEFIERINMKLPVNKRIKMVDCTYFQKYGILTDNLISLYNKHFSGFPTIFIGSIKISGANSRIEAETYLKALLEEEFIIPEYTEQKFNKDCEFIKRGLFGKRLVCK
ncbi:MAG: hypothetical protein AABY22_03895 [Nanoarchaeota archaeon]